MSVVIDASVGTPSANSYNTEAELDVFAAEMFPEPTAWTELSSGDDLRLRAMVTATRLIDSVDVPGQQTNRDQPLEHPRLGLFGYRSTEIALPVKLAHAKTTFFLIGQKCGVDPMAVGADAGVSSVAYGSEYRATFDVGATSRSAWQVFLTAVILPILGRLTLDPAYVSSRWAEGPRSVRNPFSTRGGWTVPWLPNRSMR